MGFERQDWKKKLDWKNEFGSIGLDLEEWD